MSNAPEPFVVTYSPRRTRVSFTIRPEDGKLEVRAPEGYSMTILAQIVARNSAIIHDLRLRFSERSKSRVSFQFEEGEFFLYRGCWYPLKFSRRVYAFDNAFIVPGGIPEEVKPRLEKLYRKLADEHLKSRVPELAGRFSLTVRNIKIGGASGRWGSCSGIGNLNFSWKLIQCPDDVIDYVIIHELAHRLEMNHSQRFWDEVERMCPDYRERQQFLKDNEPRYSGW